ncbi:hypothetical protein CN223_26760 [Sinorhizobium meliloti]|uniref:hypothetical protein n=1 Tax=Rhizobium meliloti TaxID=382 RepID=UPI000FD8C77E|nr:hypothetical protein [Sinorhizobium meliloti]RVG73035.1 hypothetical protein CN223_26760 [Sinorhizobium meliloti]
MTDYPYDFPSSVPQRFRPRRKGRAKIPFPWLGVDTTPEGKRILGQMPGALGLIDPGNLKTIAGVGQTITCALTGAVYTSAIANCTLVAKGSGKVLSSTGTMGFKPNLDTGIVMSKDRWTAIFVIAPDSTATGIGYLFSKIVADASEGRPDFSIGMNNLHICEFDHVPGVSSQIISDYTFGENDYKVVAISQSPEHGMTLSINGVVNKTSPTRTEGLSSVIEERMFQVGDYGANTTLDYRGLLGWSFFADGDYHDPRYADALSVCVSVMRDFYAI